MHHDFYENAFCMNGIKRSKDYTYWQWFWCWCCLDTCVLAHNYFYDFHWLPHASISRWYISPFLLIFSHLTHSIPSILPSIKALGVCNNEMVGDLNNTYFYSFYIHMCDHSHLFFRLDVKWREFANDSILDVDYRYKVKMFM